MSTPGDSRLHAPTMVATAVAVGAEPERHQVHAPAPGWWRPRVGRGQVVQPGDPLGELTVLGVVHRVVAGPGVHGAVVGDLAPGAADPGRPLMTLDDRARVHHAEDDAAVAAAAAGELAVRAPSSGRFYSRPGPGKPHFVAVGDVIATGHTVCLLEVMKTFHRVTFGGPGLPPRAKVLAIAQADEADVNAGDVLLHLEAAP